MKKMKILIGIIIICIIIVSILLFKLLPTLKEEQEELENMDYGDILDIDEETTYLGYYIVSNCIEEYIQYNIEENQEKLNYILEDTSYGIEKFGEIYYLKIEQIYKLERMNDTTYFVEAKVNNENTYYVVNVDYITKAYSIRKTMQEEFEDAKNNNVDSKYKQSIEIELNNNQINETMLTDYELANKYYNNYIKLAINNSEVAFEMLDKQNKLTRFENDIDNYKKYVENNKEKIINSIITDVQVEAQENYKKYIIQDTYERTYIITEYNYNNYTMAIEEYEIESDEDIEEFSKLSSEEKVKSNIEKIFKLLDEKEYSKVYEKLNNEFKNTNFQTLESFENYAINTFFDYNMLGQITIEEQGTNYIIKVPYKDGTSSAAEKRTKVFVMRLLEGTEFEISFQID